MALNDTVDTARRLAEIERWRRRSRRVALARKTLPLSILAIVLFLVGWAVARVVLPSLNSLPAAVGEIRMTNPRFYGRDGAGRAFLVAAKEAVRDRLQQGVITLDAPVFSLGDGKVTARRGVYREGDRFITLKDDVLFVDGKGGSMSTNEARIDTRDGSITNTAAGSDGRGVQIDSGQTRVAADSYSVTDKGDTVVFKGNVRTRINPR